MLAYLGRRLLQSVFVLLGVSVIVFGLLHLTGDPTRLLLPLEAREEDVRQLRALLGLDDPLWMQYARFLSRAVRGDFGLSFKHQVPALTLIAQTLPATLQLTAAGLALALLVAVPAGILAALRRNSLLDAICSVGVLIGQAMPVSWLGLLLVMVFAVDAIFSRDYPLVQAIVAMLATLFVLINLVMDLIYTYLDPRIVFVRRAR